MSTRSGNRNNPKSNYSDVASPSDNNEILEDKVIHLEETLKTFRAEVDMKMRIMEQVLTSRTEMFSVQKKLLEREQALHETVLSHWKNIPGLAATGLSLRFGVDDDVDLDVVDNNEDTKSSSLLGKRGYSASWARRDRKKRVMTKRRRADVDSDSERGLDDDRAVDDSRSGDNVDGGLSEGDQDAENDATTGTPSMERKVFVNYYSEEPASKPGQFVTRNPVWKYFLREEEGGSSALCKLCDQEDGIQTIVKVKRGYGVSELHEHLKMKHSNVAAELVPIKTEMDTGSTENIPTGPGTPRRRTAYNTEFKVMVCERAEEVGNRKAGVEFGINESCIRGWRNQLPSLRETNNLSRFRTRKSSKSN